MRKIPDIDSRKSRRKKRSLLRTSKQVFVLLAGALLAVGVLSWAELYKDAAGSRSLVRAFTPPIVAPAPQAPETRREDDEPSFDADALEEKLRDVARNRGGSYGVVVFDPASGKSSSVAADDEFGAASIGKLPALITLYKAAAEGKVDLDDEISILPSDVQIYGSGVLQAYPVGTRITLRECAFFLVNKSDNTAWVMLERHLGATRIQDQLERLGIRDTNYEARTTTPNDVLLMLKTIANPSFTSEKLSKEMLEAMTDTYLEDRIPAGLPPQRPCRAQNRQLRPARRELRRRRHRIPGRQRRTEKILHSHPLKRRGGGRRSSRDAGDVAHSLRIHLETPIKRTRPGASKSCKLTADGRELKFPEV